MIESFNQPGECRGCPRSAGDIIVADAEGVRSCRVTRPEPWPPREKKIQDDEQERGGNAIGMRTGTSRAGWPCQGVCFWGALIVAHA